MHSYPTIYIANYLLNAKLHRYGAWLAIHYHSYIAR